MESNIFGIDISRRAGQPGQEAPEDGFEAAVSVKKERQRPSKQPEKAVQAGQEAPSGPRHDTHKPVRRRDDIELPEKEAYGKEDLSK